MFRFSLLNDILKRFANCFNAIFETQEYSYDDKDSAVTVFRREGMFEELFRALPSQKIVFAPWFNSEGMLLRYILVPCINDWNEGEIEGIKKALTMVVKTFSALGLCEDEENEEDD